MKNIRARNIIERNEAKEMCRKKITNSCGKKLKELYTLNRKRDKWGRGGHTYTLGTHCLFSSPSALIHVTVCVSFSCWSLLFLRQCVCQVQHILSSFFFFSLFYSKIGRNTEKTNGLHWLRSMLNTLIETCWILCIESKFSPISLSRSLPIKQVNNKENWTKKICVCMRLHSTWHTKHERMNYHFRSKKRATHRKHQPAEELA